MQSPNTPSCDCGSQAAVAVNPGFLRVVPAEKGLSPAWIAQLSQRGEPETFTGDDLRLIGMPVGGLFCGTLYLGGDGRLWLWERKSPRPGPKNASHLVARKQGTVTKRISSSCSKAVHSAVFKARSYQRLLKPKIEVSVGMTSTMILPKPGSLFLTITLLLSPLTSPIRVVASSMCHRHNTLASTSS